MDKKLEILKNEYENIQIPEELSKVVANSLVINLTENGEKEKMDENIKKVDNYTKNKKRAWRKVAGLAAALVVLVGGFGIGVNTSEAFASSMSDIPLLGSLAKVFTVQKVHRETDSYVTDMNIPGIEGLKDENLQKKINEVVYNQVTKAVAETEIIMEQYKQAYMETGGTEEDYVPMEISVDYEIKAITEDILSFSVYKTQTLASAYFEMFYYNYDLRTGEPLTLKAVLGEDYMRIANEQIKAQIEERSKDENNVYWGFGSDAENNLGEEGFKTITKEQQFYVNENGNPVIVFNKYEIAPGCMGIQEFEIQK